MDFSVYFFITAITIIAILWWYTHVHQVKHIRIRGREVLIRPSSPVGFKKLRILHISDLHFHKGDNYKLKFFKRLAKIPVDLVICTGDFLEYTNGLALCLEAVGCLKPKLGIVSVFGNHDYYATKPTDYLKNFYTLNLLRRDWPERKSDKIEELKAGLYSLNIKILINESINIPYGDGNILIYGYDPFSPTYGGSTPREPFHESNSLNIALIHAPDVVEEIAEIGPDLIFAGHTHGGQVRIPNVGAITSGSTIHPRYASGMFEFGPSKVFINNGIGSGNFIRFRFACPCEVVVLDVTVGGH
jgi:predicted MPP superfamily phosphohydrolase